MIAARATLLVGVVILSGCGRPREVAPDNIANASPSAARECKDDEAAYRIARQRAGGHIPNRYVGPDGCAAYLDSSNIPTVKELSDKLPNGSDDGSGYDAGATWARDTDITDTTECSNPSSSFEEGCMDAVDGRGNSEAL